MKKSKIKKLSKKFIVGDFKLRVGRSATGKGLFATSTIPKGSCIIEYIGKPMTEEQQYLKNGKKGGLYLFEVGRNKMIDGNIPANTARYINHSCKPNCEADGPTGRVFILALRRIRAGEELTYDYDEEYFSDHIKPKGCKCNACVKKNKS